MKQIFLFLFLCLSANAIAQISAVTSTGEEVVLYDDGRWTYALEEQPIDEEILVNPKEFTGNVDNNFAIESTINDFTLKIDSKRWKFQKAELNPDAEYEFELKKKDLYASLITEQIEVPLENLGTIAYDNGRIFAPDLKVLTKEYRVVNGKKVLFMEMVGTGEGVKFVYTGYYFSDQSGSSQLICYTSFNLYDRYKEDIMSFLNGSFQ